MIGERLGKWVIFKQLGRGGMGRVYLAQEELTGKQAALKILAPDLAQEIGFLQRFQREIDTLSKLEHPNVVRFFESGLENGHYFYAMEYVEGMSLEQLLEKQSRFLWNDVLHVAMQVTPALKHVHDHGIIHRDIKPGNLILNTEGQIKLTDFGIAKVFASNQLTSSGGIVGTAEYISPEQAAGKVVGKRSDLYCLGCVLYKMLTGRPPFSGNSYVELLHKHRYGQFDRPIKFVPDVPLEVDELICQLLDKDPDKRPRDAMVLQKQLESLTAKLDRQGDRTSVDNRDDATKAENRTDKAAFGKTAALLGARQPVTGVYDSGSVLGRFFNRPFVLVMILLLCVATVALAFWPLSEEQLFQRGADLMKSGKLYDMQRAWTEFLEPLESRYPDHPHKQEVAEFRRQWEAAKAPSEAQRFFQQGELHLKQGNATAARNVWQNVVDAFGDVPVEKAWVDRARQSLDELGKAGQNTERFQSARKALDRADELRRQGKLEDAQRIWNGLEQLYRNDPAAADLLLEVHRARQQ